MGNPVPDSIENKLYNLPLKDKVILLQKIAWDNRFEAPSLAINCASKSIIFAEQAQLYDLLVQGMNYIGVINLQQSNYEEAHKFFIKSLELSEQHNLS